MRFYYLSLFSLILLGVIYFVGTGLLVWFGSWLRKRWRQAWIVMVPLFLLLYIGPIAEELLIAWNFGHLCKKDAGIFIYKTVEVEGFYDATRPTTPVPRSDQAAQDLDRGGYRFYEMVYPDFKGGPDRVVHLEKVNSVWSPTVLDRPTARYHYRANRYGIDVAHGVQRFEDKVVDTQTDEVLGRYVIYYRDAPWFFIGLDRPTIPCVETERDTRKYGTISVPALVFGRGPKENDRVERK
jgi:hypothetical protein